MDFNRDWKTCIFIAPSRAKSPSLGWIPPFVGVFKLNFDGSSLGNPSPNGFDCVIHDSKGEVVIIIADPIGVANSTKAELMGFLMGLREMRDLPISQNGLMDRVAKWGTCLGTIVRSNVIPEMLD